MTFSLGISEEYDDLPSTEYMIKRWCSGCDQHFVDHMRVAGDGLVCAVLCVTCRWVARIRRRHQSGS